MSLRRTFHGLLSAVALAALFAVLPELWPLTSVEGHGPSLVNFVAQHSGKCMDVNAANGGMEDGALIQQYTCHDGGNQEFKLVDLGGGWHYIKNERSQKCLEVPGGSTADWVQLQQRTCNGAEYQKFTVPSCSGCTSQIVAKHSGKCLDVYGSGYGDGVAVIQYGCHGGPNQRWLMAPPRYRIWLYPPGDGLLSDYSHLHCKFHGACASSSGNGLDWDSWSYPSDPDGNLRVYLANLDSQVTQPLRGDRSGNSEDEYECDYMTVSIFDYGLSAHRGAVRYLHTQTSSPGGSFSIPLGWSQSYATTMSTDNDCLFGWSGNHIHERDGPYQSVLNGDTKFNGGTYGDYCSPTNGQNDNCLKLKNNDFSNWSRYWDW